MGLCGFVLSKLTGRLSGAALALLIGVSGCHRGERVPEVPVSLQLTSGSFAGGTLNRASTCDGTGVSPPLEWTTPPAGTQSLAVVVRDLDSPFGFQFVHWVIYNLRAELRGLPAGLPAQESLPDGSRQAQNDGEKPGYYPACPPGSSVHRYQFAVYAVGEKIDLPGASRKEILQAIYAHALAKGEALVRYHR